VVLFFVLFCFVLFVSSFGCLLEKSKKNARGWWVR
jgi:cytochrome c biogenesis protein ResB